MLSFSGTYRKHLYPVAIALQALSVAASVQATMQIHRDALTDVSSPISLLIRILNLQRNAHTAHRPSPPTFLNSA